MKLSELLKKLLLLGIIISPIPILIHIFIYLKKDYPLLSLENVSILAWIVMMLIYIVAYFLIRKYERP
ncbi:uracil-DNA glycosylase [Oceanobacillus picturae]|uniref:Uracil-DNA glycosylase n=1 Tax=Oceanobacillus picturae TaxID=171693 RepID=A0A0U9HAD9_9BACI|nr:hypothetical protein [Oceanobacillus picturae]GAQ19024.1 uracil-DNA glycosylase [Oceanobacillus picturae]